MPRPMSITNVIEIDMTQTDPIGHWSFLYRHMLNV